MLYQYNKKLTRIAQKLRKDMTAEEKRLWYQFLSRLPVTVNRQKQIGNYIVDFYIATNRLVIELDGRQHAEEEQSDRDQKRDADLQKLGITVLRYTNYAVNFHFQQVCHDILLHLGLHDTDLKPPKTPY